MSEQVTLRDLAMMIDHSLLHPAMTDEDIAQGCAIADEHQVATVCIKPYSIPAVKALLAKSSVGICAVIAFPHGNSSVSIKVQEAKEAVREGSTEIDMVVNVGKVLGGAWQYVSDEIRAINDAVVAGGAILKVIFENDYLQNDHIIRLCEICSEIRVAFVKTSSGYGFVRQPNGMYAYKGATDEHLRLMREHSAPWVQVKAAGAVRTLDDLLRVRSLGATRCGATATAAIMTEAKKRGIA